MFSIFTCLKDCTQVSQTQLGSLAVLRKNENQWPKLQEDYENALLEMRALSDQHSLNATGKMKISQTKQKDLENVKQTFEKMNLIENYVNAI